MGIEEQALTRLFFILAVVEYKVNKKCITTIQIYTLTAQGKAFTKLWI
jgi:hypothetical protein